jgi:diguanylate cyclase (GGDEF)-like protein
LAELPTGTQQHGESRRRNVEHDVVALGIAVGAIILFVGTGGTVMAQVVRAWLGNGAQPNALLASALLLNIALLLFGRSRYNDLHKEVLERRRAEAQARELASIDPLTGCFNRRSGGPAIDALLIEAMARGRDVALLMVDLDNFKQINDLNGHATGDMVLTELARRIRALLPTDGIAARIGGDEFICALSYPSNQPDRVDRFAEELVDAVSAPIEAHDLHVEATVSIGIAGSRDEDGTPLAGGSETLIHRADIAMYNAKKCGRNRHHWFEQRMESELRVRAELEAGIRRGIPAGEFVPYYEQQIDLATDRLVGFEMLARWHSPRFGTVTPETFIPVAEEIDLIADLSESLIRQALEDAKTWAPALTLSVNISPLQLRDPWFAQKLLRLLTDSGFPPSRLEIEITESCLHDNVAAVRTIITTLKNHGIRISLDDFGTGYSSLSQLRALPFDRLKIDRSFVADLGGEGVSRDLVEAIVTLGRGLSLPVTAEGVESPAILQALQMMGELKGQGYLYGEPEDAATTRKRLVKMNLLATDGLVLANDQSPLRRKAG